MSSPEKTKSSFSSSHLIFPNLTKKSETTQQLQQQPGRRDLGLDCADLDTWPGVTSKKRVSRRSSDVRRVGAETSLRRFYGEYHDKVSIALSSSLYPRPSPLTVEHNSGRCVLCMENEDDTTYISNETHNLLPIPLSNQPARKGRKKYVVVAQAALNFVAVISLCQLSALIFGASLCSDARKAVSRRWGVQGLALRHGELYRLLTALLWHDEQSQALLELINFVTTGLKIETQYGSLRLLVVYMVCAFSTELALTSIAPLRIWTGAGGAAIGLNGFDIVQYLVVRQEYQGQHCPHHNHWLNNSHHHLLQEGKPPLQSLIFFFIQPMLGFSVSQYRILAPVGVISGAAAVFLFSNRYREQWMAMFASAVRAVVVCWLVLSVYLCFLRPLPIAEAAFARHLLFTA